jgi:hypothetical protein
VKLCTNVCSSAVLVLGRMWTIEVYIITTTEATVVILRLNVLESN